MNPSTKEYIKECTPSIKKYWKLDADEQAWLYPLLQKSIRSAIKVLEAISDRPRNYLEIGKITHLSEHHIKQILYAVSEAGMGIQTFSDDRAYFPIGGRPRKLKAMDSFHKDEGNSERVCV